ncbi:MAG: hypothetical protein KF774_13070 [Planctomyces sp.]|nr:hypothetical protein [Planctomyces sp.]
MTLFLGVDVGSSSIKAATLDPEAGTIGPIRSRPFPDPQAGPPLHFEIEPAQVAARIRELIDELLPRPGDCAGLVMCSQMGGLLFIGPNGEFRSPYYSWRDQRVVEPHPSGRGSWYDVYAARLNDADFRAVGRELRPGSTTTLLHWLCEKGQLPGSDAMPVTLTDGVQAHLCGAFPATDPTLALGTMNLESGAWHGPVFEAAGAGAFPHSRLQPFLEPMGRVRVGNASIPCYPAVGDHQAALRGVGLEEGELSINCSTGSQVSQATRTLVLGDYQSRPFFGGRSLNTLTHLPAGRSLNVLLDLLLELPRALGHEVRDPWDWIARESSAAPAEELDVDLSFFAGPMGDRGRIGNIRTDNLRVGPLFRAAFRNMAENYARCAVRISPARDWSAVLVSGGLPQKIPALREQIASHFETACRFSSETEETLAGLLSMAQEIASGE